MRSNGAKVTLDEGVIGYFSNFFGLVSHACQRKSMEKERVRETVDVDVEYDRKLKAAKGRENNLK